MSSETKAFQGTSVPWQQHDREYCPEEIWGDLEGPLEDGRIHGEKICDVNMDHPRAHENIALILEAGTVLHETGMGPQQLSDRVKVLEHQRAELLEALKELVAECDEAGWHRGCTASHRDLIAKLEGTQES